MGTPSTTVGPGIGAFIAFFLLALVLWLLMRNMNGRMRRMAYREQQRVEDLEAREAAVVKDGRRAARSGKRKTRRDAEAPAPSAGPQSPVEEPQAGRDEPTP